MISASSANLSTASFLALSPTESLLIISLSDSFVFEWVCSLSILAPATYSLTCACVRTAPPIVSVLPAVCDSSDTSSEFFSAAFWELSAFSFIRESPSEISIVSIVSTELPDF